MKIKETTVRCPITGEWYKRRELVASVSDKTETALEKFRSIAEDAIERQANNEGIAVMRHRALRPAKQKIGF